MGFEQNPKQKKCFFFFCQMLQKIQETFWPTQYLLYKFEEGKKIDSGNKQKSHSSGN